MEREQLISLCERAIVNHSEWSDRDSSAAQKQIGYAWALLKAGCRFEIETIRDNTIWLYIYFNGFGTFEGLQGEEWESFYIPTEQRLNECDNKDWY